MPMYREIHDCVVGIGNPCVVGLANNAWGLVCGVSLFGCLAAVGTRRVFL